MFNPIHPDWVLVAPDSPWGCPTCGLVQLRRGVRCWRGPGVDPLPVCLECYLDFFSVWTLCGDTDGEHHYESGLLQVFPAPDGGWELQVDGSDQTTHYASLEDALANR